MKNIQDQYLLRMPLDGMKRVSSEKINCRCWSCGDSKKDKRKKRGWFIWNKRYNTYVYFCHNCGISTNFKHVLSILSNASYTMYLEEEKKENFNSYIHPKQKTTVHVIENDISLELLPSGSVKASNNEECMTYLKKRKIPQQFIDRWYFHKKYGVIVPFEFEDELVYGWQGRRLDKKEFHTDLPENNPKIWNYYSVNRTQTVYVTESVIDATMMYHIGYQGIAMIGADVNPMNLSEFSDLVFIFDNDETGRLKIIKYSNIFKKARFLIWDKRIQQKDLNEILVSGVDLQKFKKFIDTSLKTSYEVSILSKMKLL